MKKNLIIITGLLLCAIIAIVGLSLSDRAATADSDTDLSTSLSHQSANDYVWQESETSLINLSDQADGSTVTISDGGAYRLTGSLTGNVIINAEDETVQLILDNANITSTNGPAIEVADADQVIVITRAQSNNNLADTADYADTDEDAANAALFSKADLSIYGETGSTLNIVGNYEDAIHSKDGLIISSANLQISAVDDGLQGNDYLTIENSQVDVASGDDGLHSNEIIAINQSDLTIASGDDGIHADTEITINGGQITITKSYEGIESAMITVDDSAIDITASDDGFNVAGGNDDSGSTDQRGGRDVFAVLENAYLTINSGVIHVNAGGDGLDSNGSIIVTGGYITVNGPINSANGAIDYNGDFIISGGTLIAIGSSGMAEAPGQNSTQNSLLINLTETQAAGSQITLIDEQGVTIVEMTAAKQFNSVVISTPELEQGATYTLNIDGAATTEVTLEGVTTMSGAGGMMGGGMMGNFDPTTMPTQGGFPPGAWQ